MIDGGGVDDPSDHDGSMGYYAMAAAGFRQDSSDERSGSEMAHSNDNIEPIGHESPRLAA